MLRIDELKSTTQLDDILFLGEKFIGEYPTRTKMDERTVVTRVARMLADETRSHENCWIAYDDDKPIGLMVGHAAPELWSPGVHAVHDLWYTLPEYRTGKASVLLLRAFEEWARLLGAYRITLTVALSAATDVEKVSNLFTRMGYKRAGHFHVKETV